MGRQFDRKRRDKQKRRPKPLILLVAEGTNMTESQYFRSFQNQNAEYTIKILKPGHRTDPYKMLQIITSYWDDNELSEENGDAGFVVLDLDCDEEKAGLIRALAQDSSCIQFAVSNPCFEVWFLMHFKYSTHSFLSSQDVVRELKTEIPDYSKNKDVSVMLVDKLGEAMKNAGKLNKHYDSIDCVWPSNQCNPRTDVPKIIDAMGIIK